MEKVDKIVNEARRFLKQNPFDVGHDLEHHLKVLQLAIDIANHIEESVNSDALRIACMWHDVIINPGKKSFTNRPDLTEETYQYLDSLLKKENSPQNLIDKVLMAVREHGFEKSPLTTEGKVLYDADKLAALDIKRWKKVVKAYNSGQMTEDHFKVYQQAVKKWLETMRSRLNFEYSKSLHDKRIKKLLNNKEIAEAATKYGWNLGAALPR